MSTAWTSHTARRTGADVRPNTKRLGLALSVAVLLSQLATSVEADSYQQSWHRAAALEQEGRFEEAADELESLSSSYPQDYGLALQRAWLQFQAREYAASETSYRRALSLSSGSFEAKLGLAWSLIRQGDLEEARAELESLGAASPGHPAVQEALAYTELPTPRSSWSTWVSASMHEYGQLPSVSWGRGLALGVSGLIWDRVIISTSYRFTRFGWEPTDAASVDSVEWNKHEVFTSLGLIFSPVRFSATYGRLLSSLNSDGDAHIVGLSTLFDLFGELRIDGALAFFSDVDVFQLTPSWSLSLTDVLWLRPGATLQSIDGEILWSGGFDLIVAGEPGALSIGAWAGDQERRIDLELPTVYDLGTTMTYGGAIDGRLDFDNWSLSAGYELAGVELDEDGSIETEIVHWFGLGLSFRLP